MSSKPSCPLGRQPLLRTCWVTSLGWFSLACCLATQAVADVSFERVQLSDEFYSEGGTHGDYDGDGHGDVAVGPWIYYGPQFNDRSRYYDGEAFTPEKYSENFLMYTTDVNGDARPDIIVLGFPGKESWWYQNPGTSARQQLWTRHTILDSVDNESPLIADIDGDGQDDLICSSKGHYGYATHAGQNPTDMWRFVKISPNNNYHRFTHGLGIGDVNNDGHRDLLEKDGWWENPGKTAGPSGKTTEWTFHAFPFANGGAQMAALDLDGDGRNEVLTGLVAHGFGLVYYKAIDAAATQFERIDIMTDDPATSPVGLAISQLHAMDLGDINQDGLPDIVTGKRWWAHANKDVGNSQPAMLVWLELQRSGGRVQFVPHVIDVSSGVGTQVTVGDVNQDGLLDIVSGTKRGAYLFLQRPANLAADQPMLADRSAADAFGQRPASEYVQLSSSDAFVPALQQRPLNFDFEQEALADWEVRGPMAATILRESPSNDQGQGKYVVDTGSDKPALIGEMISRPFRLQFNRLSFQIAGKPDPETRLELVDNSTGIVLASQIPEQASLQPGSFDIQQLAGKTVRLRIIDHSDTAYIQLDQFRLHP
jgi:hypothetical protein